MPTILVTSASYILSDYLPTSEGDHCYNLFKQMQKHNYQFEAISEHVSLKKPLNNLKAYSVGTFKAPPTTNPIEKYITHVEFLTRSTLKAAKLLRQKKIDIIHHMLPTVYNQTFSPLALTGKTKGYPFIIGPASAHYYKRPTDEKLLTPITKRLHKATIKKADKLITLTQQVKELYQNHIQEDGVEVVPFAVDTETFRPSENEQKENELLYVGSLYELKGLHHLLQALTIVTKEKPQTRLRIVGGGPQEATLHHMVHAWKLQKNVTLEGQIPHNHIAPYYQHCTLFCFPTQGEPFGKTLIEAMACAKPTIATDVGGPKEIVQNGETGFLVPTGQPKVLAERITMLLDDEVLRRSMGRNARRVALEKYSWPKIAEKYRQIYESFL